MRVTRVILTHPRVKAKRKLKPPQPSKRLPQLRRRKRRLLQRKRLLRKPRRSKKRKKAPTLVTKAKVPKAEAKTKKTVGMTLLPTLVQMMNKRKENPPRNDHEKHRLFLNS